MQRIRDLLLRAESRRRERQRVIADAGRHIGIAAASLATCSTPS